MFTIGDAESVMAWSRPLILNPLEGHPRKLRQLASNELWGTIKELAQLDGAFVVSDDGVGGGQRGCHFGGPHRAGPLTDDGGQWRLP